MKKKKFIIIVIVIILILVVGCLLVFNNLSTNSKEVKVVSSLIVEQMSVDEAILQMNLIGHQFFFFKNADNNDAPAVIYKRAAGGYGLIESE